MVYGKHDGRIYLPIESDAPDGRITWLITDVSIVSSVRGPKCQLKLSPSDALESDRAAKNAYYNKIVKYNWNYTEIVTSSFK